MKRILIIGKNSYIGKNVKKYLESYSHDQMVVEAVSGESGEWQDLDFFEFDVVIMCSALVHKKEKKLGWNAYLQANAQLPAEIAEKAENQGVEQYIFLSSLAVYGRGYEKIEIGTEPKPETYYGQSKLLAEEALLEMETENFRVAVLRLPMVYGRKAKGSYCTLRKLAKYYPFFPKIENQKSVISIRQLCRFLEKVITEEKRGIFHPQDKEYLSTSVLAQKAGRDIGRTVWLLPFCPYLHGWLKKKSKFWRKSFGDLTVDKEIDRWQDTPF